MKILITGICGFAGKTIAEGLREHAPDLEIIGFDNFSRPGSELHRPLLKKLGIPVFHADLRAQSDWEAIPRCDWVIDAAANPSVLAGLSGQASSRQLIENNLWGTVELLEYCKRHQAGAIFLSTSRVYSIHQQLQIPLVVQNQAFCPSPNLPLPAGVSDVGITEEFSTQPPLSLYGSSKLASETLALEYGETFQFPVWINRCGVLAGASQFGKPDQGIFSYWIHSWYHRKPLKYLGFDGTGYQVRDCLHPADLVPLLLKQIRFSGKLPQRIFHCSGGIASARSLKQLSDWCEQRFGVHAVESSQEVRPFDLPWVVLSSERAKQDWDWQPARGSEQIWEEIASFAEQNPDWFMRSQG